GRKYFLIGGNIIFLLASAACGAAPSMTTLIIFRAIQGIGGGMIFSSVFATTGDLFPPAERIKYMGLFTGTFSLASVLGPTVGGFLTDNGGWRWIFYMNLPFSLIAIPAVMMNLPNRPSSLRPKIDFVGAVILSLASVSLLLALVWAGDKYAWGSPEIIGLIGVSVLLIGVFILQEWKFPEPLLPLHLFRNRTFLLTNLVVFALGVGMFGAIQYLSIFVQTSLGASATDSGIITTPQSIGLLFASVVGGQVIGRTGRYKIQTILGSLLIIAATLFLAQIGVGTEKWHISAFMVVLGLGFGAVMPTMSMLVQNAVDHKYLGVATSANQFFRQIGSVLGIAIFGAVLANSYHHSFTNSLSDEQRAQLTAPVVKELDDPTLSLNPAAFEKVKSEVPDQNLLAAALDAQKEGVAVGIRHIYLIALIVSILSLGLVVMVKEIPLRKTFGSAPAPAASSGDTPARAPEAEQLTPKPLPGGGGGGGAGGA
ncbi:hypothetical protein AYO38_07800, partial [bacterium SCGC AG-212-C10]